jgi:Thermostable hemolysin
MFQNKFPDRHRKNTIQAELFCFPSPLRCAYTTNTWHVESVVAYRQPPSCSEQMAKIRNQMIKLPESGPDMKSLPLTVHFSGRDAADRAEIEQFIAAIFFQVCGAKVRFFLPTLMSLRDQDGKLVAACGIRNAGTERLYLESYMDKPVEQVISELTGSTVERSDIVEIGNYSVAEMGMSRQLISAIFDQLHATSKQWAVFTAVQVVRNALIKSGIIPEILCDADIKRLPPEEQFNWGSYYEQKPQIMAVKRMERRKKPRGTGE